MTLHSHTGLEMNESRPQDAAAEPEAATTPYLRLPVPLVAIGLVVFLAALLGVGLWANANLRQRGVPSLEAPTTVGLAAAPTSTAAPAVTDARTLTPAPTSTPVPIVQATPTAVPAAEAATQPPPAPTATYAPTPLVIVLGGTETPTPSAAPSANTPTPLPTVEPTLAAEVGQAYENFWRVTSQALLELDASHLDEVMDGNYLASIRDRISQLSRDGQAIKTHVILNYSVVEASHEFATVVDDFEDDSIYIKVGTDEPVSAPTGDQVRTLYKLQNISGVWKVIDSVRSE